MKIIFWVPYPTEGASNRYRVEQYLPFLKEKGIDCVLRPFWRSSVYKILYREGHTFKKMAYFFLGVFSRVWDIFFFFRYDLFFIHRESMPIGGAIFERLLFLSKKPFIFDFDDAIFLASVTKANNFIEKFKRPEKAAQIIRMSSHVIAGNRFLSEYARQYNTSVTIIPTSVDCGIYRAEHSHGRKEITVGWIGSMTTQGYLADIKNVFTRLSRALGNIRFKIIGGHFSVNGLSNIVSKPWSLEEELRELGTFDIGIMPMPENNWTKGKCGFKAILYMSMGISCVCSPVGAILDIINEGYNGFFADTEDEWVAKISALALDPGLREKIGNHGRKTAQDKYSVATNSPKFINAILNTYSSFREGR